MKNLFVKSFLSVALASCMIVNCSVASYADTLIVEEAIDESVRVEDEGLAIVEEELLAEDGETSADEAAEENSAVVADEIEADKVAQNSEDTDASATDVFGDTPEVVQAEAGELSDDVEVSEDGGTVTINVVDYGAVPNDGQDDYEAFNKAVYKLKNASADGSKIVLKIPSGTFNLSQSILLYSNMKVEAASDTVVTTASGVDFIFVAAENETGNNGGYNRIHDVEITGGTWDGAASDKDVKGAFMFGHGKNINIHDLTVKRFTYHIINVSSCQNVSITNVKFENQVVYTGTDKDYWGDYTVGDPERYKFNEAIHTDYAGPGENFGERDNTVPDNITIKNCVFDGVDAGIGTHRENSPKAKNVTVTECSFKNVKYGPCLNAFCFDNFVFTNNYDINATMAVKAIESTGTIANNSINVKNGEDYFGAIHLSKSNATVEKNVINNANDSAIKILNGSVVVATENKINKSVNDAVYLGSDAEVTLNNNTIENAGRDGIKLDETKKCTVLNNTIKDSKRVGINALKTRDVVEIMKNTISSSSAEKGVVASYCQNVVNFVGNSVSGSYSDTGVLYYGSKGDIKSNNISGSKNAPITCIGEQNYYCEVTITENTTKPNSTTKEDILLTGYGRNSKVGGNIMSGKGIVAGKSFIYTKITNDTTQKNKWVKDGTGWYYLNGYGDRVKGWNKLGNSWYFFDSNGYMKTGWFKEDGKWYYLESSGAMACSKWVGGQYYMKASGAMATNEWVDNNKYYVGADGKWIPNYKNGGGTTPSKATEGWKKDKGGWKYLLSNGSYQTNSWKQIGGKWYHFDKNGYMQTGWVKDGGKWYFLNSSGAMATGWIKDGGKWYYLHKDGHMAANETVEGKYKIGKDGVWIQ